MISRFALPRRLLGTARAFSSLRSSRNPGLRGGRRVPQQGPIGIPNNATTSSQKLVDRIKSKQAQFEQEREQFEGSGNDNSLLSPVFVPASDHGEKNVELAHAHFCLQLLDGSIQSEQRSISTRAKTRRFLSSVKFTLRELRPEVKNDKSTSHERTAS